MEISLLHTALSILILFVLSMVGYPPYTRQNEELYYKPPTLPPRTTSSSTGKMQRIIVAVTSTPHRACRLPCSNRKTKAVLQAYINVTIDLFHITDGNPSDPQKTQLKQGTCKENGCGTLLPGCPSRKPNCNNPNPIMAEWAPKKMMKIIFCDTSCNCNYPRCPDVPDDPKTKHWCSLCGPKFNAPIGITLYYPSD